MLQQLEKQRCRRELLSIKKKLYRGTLLSVTSYNELSMAYGWLDIQSNHKASVLKKNYHHWCQQLIFSDLRPQPASGKLNTSDLVRPTPIHCKAPIYVTKYCNKNPISLPPNFSHAVETISTRAG